jgi:putative FmdB family regulatory protein
LPIYAYACKKCDHTLDALQKIADPRLVDCPSCGEPDLKRLLSAPRFRLKGQGWYETDFKTGDKRNIAGDTDGKKVDKKDTKDTKDTKDKKDKVDAKPKSAADKKSTA